MNTKELKVILKTADDLGFDNLGIVIDDNRDGNSEFVTTTVKIAKDNKGFTRLVINYE